MHRRSVLIGLAAGAAAGLAARPGVAREARPWPEILAKARGQTVYWNAWGGDERTNAFIAWAGQEV
ncbi:MAG: ABC transporter substrate-binding protein, partial [Alphaproteobacteria bacterium]|nr:ABC transporter substrate-binding protein [Alphaproteobacteria bacterium]